MSSDPPAALKRVVRPAKLSEQIEEQLNEAIHKQVFGPGELLPSETKLAKIFGVSRNVIREALLILSAKGLVELKKGKAATVIVPSIDHVLDPFSKLVDFKCGKKGLTQILFVRQLLEPTVAATAAEQRSEKDVKALQKSLQSMQLSKDDKNKFSFYDIQFHGIIARASKNPLIPIVLEPLYHVLVNFHPPIFYDAEIIENTLLFHSRIYDAISRHEKEQTFDLMKEHLEKAEEHNLRLSSRKRPSA